MLYMCLSCNVFNIYILFNCLIVISLWSYFYNTYHQVSLTPWLSASSYTPLTKKFRSHVDTYSRENLQPIDTSGLGGMINYFEPRIGSRLTHFDLAPSHLSRYFNKPISHHHTHVIHNHKPRAQTMGVEP